MKKRAKEIIKEWLKKNVDNYGEIKNFSHWQFRSYVIGYAAPACLIVAGCWVDAEPQIRKDCKKYPMNTIHLFDNSLKAGDWCFTCYISSESIGQEIALPLDLLYEDKK